jgi:hypothetical protein
MGIRVACTLDFQQPSVKYAYNRLFLMLYFKNMLLAIICLLLCYERQAKLFVKIKMQGAYTGGFDSGGQAQGLERWSSLRRPVWSFWRRHGAKSSEADEL